MNDEQIRWLLEHLEREKNLDRLRRINFWRGLVCLIAVLIASILTFKRYF